MTELIVLSLALPVGIILAIGIKMWMNNLTPTKRHAKILAKLKKIDRKAWETFCKEQR